MNARYDLLIIGGGMVGASLACAMAGQGLRIALVEAMAPEPAGPGHPSYDDRVLALAYGTRRIFEGLGLWGVIGADATPILRIHVSDRGSPGLAHLDSREEGVEALGYVTEARRIGAALMARLRELEGVELLCPATLEEVTIHSDSVHATLVHDGRRIQVATRLLVGADGAQSRVRRQLGIDAVRWDYGQSAVIANVTPSLAHRNVAFERFTACGPIALLPMSGGRCAVVCTVPSGQADAVRDLGDAAFSAYLQERFGDRLGRFERVGRRQAYGLFMLKSREHARYRVAVIGNAAHTLHPIAGQGFNLGLRDVAALAEVITDAHRVRHDIGDRLVLERYAEWRRWDQRRTIAFTDGLNRLFASPLLPVRLARDLGLLVFDLFPPAKRLLARQTMGLNGHLPRLVRGLPLASGRVSCRYRLPAKDEG